jgi:hypothetical protein
LLFVEAVFLIDERFHRSVPSVLVGTEYFFRIHFSGENNNWIWHIRY